MSWQGNNVFRSGGVSIVPPGSTANRLMAGQYGPHPFMSAPPGYGGIALDQNRMPHGYGAGSPSLAQLLAGGAVPQPGSGTPPPPTVAPAPAAPEPAKPQAMPWIPGQGLYFSGLKTPDEIIAWNMDKR